MLKFPSCLGSFSTKNTPPKGIESKIFCCCATATTTGTHTFLSQGKKKESKKKVVLMIKLFLTAH
jgi:hypothetical protein